MLAVFQNLTTASHTTSKQHAEFFDVPYYVSVPITCYRAVRLNVMCTTGHFEHCCRGTLAKTTRHEDRLPNLPPH
jgi:hypothetical protein